MRKAAHVPSLRAATHYNDPKILAQSSEECTGAMKGLAVAALDQASLMQFRGQTELAVRAATLRVTATPPVGRTLTRFPQKGVPPGLAFETWVLSRHETVPLKLLRSQNLRPRVLHDKTNDYDRPNPHRSTRRSREAMTCTPRHYAK